VDCFGSGMAHDGTVLAPGKGIATSLRHKDGPYGTVDTLANETQHCGGNVRIEIKIQGKRLFSDYDIESFDLGIGADQSFCDALNVDRVNEQLELARSIEFGDINILHLKPKPQFLKPGPRAL
jgi:hypothetical protein